ncbi:hypothetical protein C8J57DRAFT_1102564 [Mycena rebaudengoi]|nr:hypothetical protein C8J57DRAFT_1102564 [Mycena rebaudengoi]
MPRGLAHLLNPSDPNGQRELDDIQAGLVDIGPELRQLTDICAARSRASISVQQQLRALIHDLSQPTPTVSPAPPPLPRVSESGAPQYDVRLNRRTVLSILYHHPKDTILEYPETGPENPVGHLFRLDPDDWQVPDLNIAYSRGAPGGQTLAGREVFNNVFVGVDGEPIPCSESHSTCQGVKICPSADRDLLSEPHTKATRKDIEIRVQQDREERLQYASPSKDVFCRTAAYLSALRKHGCCRPLLEPTAFTTYEEQLRQTRDEYLYQAQRGYHAPEAKCEGRLTSRDHFFDAFVGVSTGAYDVEYIEAVLCQDEDEITRIEAAAASLGYGPNVVCTTVANASAQRAFCPFDHRTEDNQLLQPLMVRLECRVKFRVIQPLEEYRAKCPYVLITSQGAHWHPVPLPIKTPPKIRTEFFHTLFFHLLDSLGPDLADLTPRRLLRHSLVKSFLKQKFPIIPKPTLGDLHISFSNRSHLKAYIKQAKEFHCPFKTGWNGLLHLKALQDANLPSKDHYIRRMIALDLDTVPRHDEDDWESGAADDKLRIIICMYRKGSERLVSACSKYLQSDIAFKRIVGYYEFEIAGMDRDANSGLVYCRVFVNRQSAFAHQQIFAEIEAIIYADTGKRLRWRHLHAVSLDDHEGLILGWGADQHRGQAKGLGLHLQSIAAQMPLKADLHEPRRTIQSLSPYEHLHRLFRLCSNHFYRNIKTCAVSEEVRHLMRSLLCIEHPNWDATLAKIREKGGKAGNAWLRDKESSGFVFQGICWEKSFIPLDVFRSMDPTTNISEGFHSNVNLEGIHCSLLGGVQKAETYDAMKLASLQVCIFYLVGRHFS